MSNFVEIRDKDNALLGQLPVSKEGGRLRNVVYITSTDEYEKPAWLKFVRAKGVGGGGGGGGAASTSSSQMALGAGGGGGGYFEKIILASALAVSETVTIGPGGAGGTAGANAGQAGGTTSFGAHCSGAGGAGGSGCVAVATTSAVGANEGVGGLGVGGDFNKAGESGNGSRLFASGQIAQNGAGGSSVLGPSGPASGMNSTQNGIVYGGGGSGANNYTSQSARAGGNGAPGIVIIEEYE